MMKQYESIDAFLQALPPHVKQLEGHDNLFLLKTRQGRVQYIRLRDGHILLETESGEAPVCTVEADEEALLGLICGKISPMRLLMTGKARVKGDVRPLIELIGLIPK